MNLTKRNRRSPLNLFQAFGNPEFSPLWDSFWADELAMEPLAQRWPSLEVKEDEGEYLVKAEVPGLSKDDVRVEIDHNILEISGEKREESEDNRKGKHFSEVKYGSFFRSIPFEKPVDAERVSAQMLDGVLKVRVAKKTFEGAGKRSVNIG